MAVFTQINDAQLAEFMADYALANVTAFKGIAAGVQNSNFIVETGDEKYILTIYEDTATGVNPDDLPYFLGLMQHLAAHGINCPTPIMQKNGNILGQLAERPAALVSFLPGRGTVTPKPQQCRAVGAALAELHLAGADFEMQRINRQGPDNWRKLYEKSQDSADEASPGWPILSGKNYSVSKRLGRKVCLRVSFTPTCFPIMCFLTRARSAG